MPLDSYRLIDDPSQLPGALEWLADLDPIGVDVERADWNRYYRSAALVQIGGDGRVALLDPLELDDWTPIERFLGERAILLHALENDVAPLQALGVDPPVVHDTAIAAAVLGLPMGLETMLADLLDIEMTSDKSKMQRADWEARPLTEEMLVYAAGDVADLPRLWALVEEQLHQTGRYEWYQEELAATRDQPTIEERRDWERTKGVGRLDPKARARAKALWTTREDLARTTDTAPGRIVNDKTLVDLALKPPNALRELGRRGVRRQSVREFGEDLIQALEIGANAEPEPVRRNGRRASDADRELADELRALRASIAEDHGLDAGMLCPSRILLRAVMSDPQSPEELKSALGLRNWQWELLADDFVATVFVDEGTDAAAPAKTRT
ncbi:ribonuclease D [Euzebya tangerina]|uniref:ribonuclease D n=1 Tax=Euzebya tangerina TaxID=591198 RepID=UPI0013C2A061|nr:HRDC domain-containing protein [Euzebya tangerina]